MSTRDDKRNDSGSNDENLRILVELAANGDLSPDETTEVEGLIANKPHLVDEYQRLAESRKQAPPSPQPRHGSSSGCLYGIGAFTIGLVAFLVVGFVLMPRNDDAPTDSPVNAIIEDQNQVSLPLDGPTELTELGRLALIYSPDADAAVLLGDPIPSGGELYVVDDPDTAIVEFAAGKVEVLVRDVDPAAQYAVRSAPDR